MRNIGKKGLLVLCLVSLAFAFSLIVIGDAVPPDIDKGECEFMGGYWWPDDTCHLEPPPPPDDPDPDPPPPDPDPPPPDNPDSDSDPDPEPELESEPTCWDEVQALYDFSRQELKALKEDGFNCAEVMCAMRYAGKDKERFLQILYNDYTLDPGISDRMQIGPDVLLSLQIYSDNGELVPPADAAKLVLNLTAARISEDGKKNLIILDQENRDICLLFTFDPESNRFFLVWKTAGLQPGEYELYLGLRGLCQSCSPTFRTVLFGEE